MNKYSCSFGLCLASCTQPKKRRKRRRDKIYCYQSYKIDTSFTKQYVSQIRSVRNIEIEFRKDFTKHLCRWRTICKKVSYYLELCRNVSGRLLKAQSRSKGAEIELQNTKPLPRKKYSFQKRTVFGSSQLEQARAEVALAKLHLSSLKSERHLSELLTIPWN
jgi:membrane fusion protein (multidrug efflux system)